MGVVAFCGGPLGNGFVWGVELAPRFGESAWPKPGELFGGGSLSWRGDISDIGEEVEFDGGLIVPEA